MKLTRRGLLGGFGALALSGCGLGLAEAGGVSAASASETVHASQVALTKSDDGLWHEDWFVESFLDLRDDVKEAADAGKHFAVLWEQKGCPYCEKMHKVNFSRPEIRDYIKANFNILQLNIWGARKVTDFDGREMSERKLARRWRVHGTPTINFFHGDLAYVIGRPGIGAEVYRIPGYFGPKDFLSIFKHVRTKWTK